MTHPHDAMAQLFQAAPSNDLPDVPNFNVCPTTPVAVVTASEGTRRLSQMRWGFIPHWYKKPAGGPLLINARAETIAEKPAFRAAVRTRRCLIPATGFYEWTKGEDDARLPWYFTRSDGFPLVFAGIWQEWRADGGPLATCAIVTTGASDWMAQTHHREPVVIERADWPIWLGETSDKAAPLMRAAAQGIYQRWRVDRAVNSNRASGEELIAPLAVS